MTASRTKSLEPKLTLLVREQHTKTFHISVHCWTHPTITGLTLYKVFVFFFFFNNLSPKKCLYFSHLSTAA